MKKLSVLMLRSYVGPFMLGLSITLLILIIQFISMQMHHLMGKNLDIDILGKLFFYAGGRLLVTAIPTGILSASLLTFGNMGEHYELAAIKSTGISLFKIMRPLIVVALFFTVFSLWFSFSVIPKANLKFFSLLWDVKQKKPEMVLDPGEFFSEIDGFVIRTASKNDDNGMLYDVLLYDHTDKRGNNDVTYADSARMFFEDGGYTLKMVLYNGGRHEEFKPKANEEDRHALGRSYFDSLYYKFDMSEFMEFQRTDERLFARHQITLTRNELRDTIRVLRNQDSVSTQALREYIVPYSKIDTSFLAAYEDTVDLDTNLFKPISLKPGERLLDKFPEKNAFEVMNKTLSNARAIKNYTEFTLSRKNEEAKSLRKYQIEYQFMHSIPVVCIIFMLIGSSLGAIIRKGGLGVPAIVSIGFFVIFYVLVSQGKKLAKEGIVEVWFGTWMCVIFLAPIALFLTYRATMDVSLLDEGLRDKIRERVSRLFQKKPS